MENKIRSRFLDQRNITAYVLDLWTVCNTGEVKWGWKPIDQYWPPHRLDLLIKCICGKDMSGKSFEFDPSEMVDVANEIRDQIVDSINNVADRIDTLIQGE